MTTPIHIPASEASLPSAEELREAADGLDRISRGALADYDGCIEDEQFLRRQARTLRAFAAQQEKQPVAQGVAVAWAIVDMVGQIRDVKLDHKTAWLESMENGYKVRPLYEAITPMLAQPEKR